MAFVGAQIRGVEGSHDALAARTEIESIDDGSIGADYLPVNLPHGTAMFPPQQAVLAAEHLHRDLPARLLVLRLVVQRACLNHFASSNKINNL